MKFKYSADKYRFTGRSWNRINEICDNCKCKIIVGFIAEIEHIEIHNCFCLCRKCYNDFIRQQTFINDGIFQIKQSFLIDGIFYKITKK